MPGETKESNNSIKKIAFWIVLTLSLVILLVGAFLFFREIFPKTSTPNPQVVPQTPFSPAPNQVVPNSNIPQPRGNPKTVPLQPGQFYVFIELPIYVKTPRTQIPAVVHPNASIMALKNTIQAAINIPVQDVQLRWNNMILEDNKFVRDYNLPPDALIYLYLKSKL